jgi:hypothetical protein
MREDDPVRSGIARMGQVDSSFNSASLCTAMGMPGCRIHRRTKAEQCGRVFESRPPKMPPLENGCAIWKALQ